MEQGDVRCLTCHECILPICLTFVFLVGIHSPYFLLVFQRKIFESISMETLPFGGDIPLVPLLFLILDGLLIHLCIFLSFSLGF